MIKKILCAPLLIAVLWCTPYTQMDLAPDSADITAVSGAAPQIELTLEASPMSPSGSLPTEPAPAPAAGTPVSGPKAAISTASAPAQAVIAAVSQQQTVPAVTDTIYSYSLSSSVGTLTYFNQSDARWAAFLYGGSDRMAAYGCGPTAMAMIVTSFTESPMPPPDMANWAAANGYWAPGSGTRHSFIPDCAAAFGLKAEPFQNFTEADVLSALKKGHIFVALMGPGHLSDSGHFIIIADYWSGSQVRIADPASLDNTKIPWDINLILNELSYARDAGAPLWMITPN